VAVMTAIRSRPFGTIRKGWNPLCRWLLSGRFSSLLLLRL
jgi:hypothetical protein